MKIAVVGTGYVGLVLGACMAESGNDVICVDKDTAKVAMLRRGKIPIYEPGLEEIVKRNKSEGRLVFTTDLPKAVRAAEVCFIAVGTPQGEDGSADLRHVMGVAREIARAMNGYKVIVNKSTVPVGTAEKVREVVRRETTHPFSVVSNPEFLKQGAAVDDFMKPDRVVIGAEDPRAAELMVKLHQPFTRTGAPIMVMDCPSAELSKYASNAILATKISFMNEIANVCDLFGADVDRVRQAVGVRQAHRHLVPVSRRRLRRQLLPEGRQGAHQVLVGPEVRLQDPQGRGRGQRVPEARAREEDRSALRQFAEGQDDRGLGPGVQAEDRRHARGAGDSDHRGAACQGREDPGVTIRRR